MKNRICFWKRMFCKEQPEQEQKHKINVEEQRILSGQFNDIICPKEEVLHQLFEKLQGNVKAEDVLDFFADIGLGFPVEISEIVNDSIKFKVKDNQYSLLFMSVGLEYIVIVSKEDGESNYFQQTQYKYIYHVNTRILTPTEFYVIYPNNIRISTIFYGTTVYKVVGYTDFDLCLTMYYKDWNRRDQELPLTLYGDNIDEYLVGLTGKEAKDTDGVYEKLLQIMKLTRTEIEKAFSFTVTAQHKLSGIEVISSSGK